MKNEDKQFDDFLRSRFEDRTFEQKDHYWTNAREIISTHRKAQRRGILTFSFSALVLASLSAALLWNNSTTTPIAASGIQETSYDTQVNPLPVNNIGEATANADASQANNSSSVTVNDGKKRNSGKTKPAAAKAQNNHAVNGRGETSSVAMLASFTPAAGNASISNTGNNVNDNTTGDRTSGNPAKAAVAKAKRSNKGIVKTGNASALTEETKRNDRVTSAQMGSRFYRPLAPTTLTLDSFTKKAALLDYTSRDQKSFFTIEAGLNYYNAGSETLKSFNFHGGLRYYYFVSPKIGFSTGLGYSRIHQNAGTRTYKDIDYSFGQQARETRITTQRLDYIELPLDVHYRVNGNHFATAGATASYAIMSGEYVEYSSGGTNGTRSNKNLNAVNKFDVQLHLGYNYILNNRYTFSAGYYFGLMDISKNSAFKSNQFDRNSGIRFTLGYKLF
jgi:hypothetical protein